MDPSWDIRDWDKHNSFGLKFCHSVLHAQASWSVLVSCVSVAYTTFKQTLNCPIEHLEQAELRVKLQNSIRTHDLLVAKLENLKLGNLKFSIALVQELLFQHISGKDIPYQLGNEWQCGIFFIPTSDVQKYHWKYHWKCQPFIPFKDMAINCVLITSFH